MTEDGDLDKVKGGSKPEGFGVTSFLKRISICRL